MPARSSRSATLAAIRSSKLPCLGVQHLQLLVQLLQPLQRSRHPRPCPLAHAHVASRVQAPALRLDLVDRRHLAQARHVDVASSAGKLLLHQWLGCPASTSGSSPRYSRAMFARNSIWLGVKSRCARSIWRKMCRASMNSTLSRRSLRLAPVEEPERAGQRHRVEEVGADRDDHIDRPGLDQLAPDLQLGAPRVRRRVGHHEAGPALLVESRRRRAGSRGSWRCPARDAEGEPRVALDPLLVDPVDVERRIGHHEVEPADRLVRDPRSRCWPP